MKKKSGRDYRYEWSFIPASGKSIDDVINGVDNVVSERWDLSYFVIDWGIIEQDVDEWVTVWLELDLSQLDDVQDEEGWDDGELVDYLFNNPSFGGINNNLQSWHIISKISRIGRVAKRLDKAKADGGLKKTSILVSELRGGTIGDYIVVDVNNGLVDFDDSVYVKFVDFGEDEIISITDKDNWDKVLNELSECGIESVTESGVVYKIYASFDWSGLDYNMEEGEEYFTGNLAIYFDDGSVVLNEDDLKQIGEDLYTVETNCRNISDGFELVTVVEYVD